MKQEKKGFTLIELMVVIVIIGILAAIAIPKLFGMSAKAKAQEVGPAASTWVKLQQAFKMETGRYGDIAAIGYKIPGFDAETAVNKGATANFTYTVDGTPKDQGTAEETEGSFSASSIFSADGCGTGTVWSAEFPANGTSDDPEVDIKPSGGVVKIEDCQALTPNFCKMGAGTKCEAEKS